MAQRASVVVDVKCACGKTYSTKAVRGRQHIASKRIAHLAGSSVWPKTRTAKALKDMELIGNLASNQYEKEQKHVDMILGALGDSLTVLANKFNKPVRSETKTKFSLKTAQPEHLAQLNQQD